MDDGIQIGEDGVARCWWGSNHEDYSRYHDEEWGRPQLDDATLYEKLCLEGFQSGLSWLTILRKRERFRKVFKGFDPKKVARFGERDVERLLGDAGIIRHRGKIEATINNARCVLALQKEFGSFAAYIWQFEPSDHQSPPSKSEIRATTPESVALSKDLRKRGFKFVGPTTAYAFMQAMGLVNDHLPGCDFHRATAQARAAVTPPGTAG